MTCSYCGTRLGEGELRCPRCGRKDDDRLTGGFSLVTAGALATAPARMAREFSARRAAPRPAQDMGRAVQTSLFPDRPASNVVLIAPPRSRSTARKTKPRTGRLVPEGQGKLEFLEAAPAKPRTLGTTVEARIYCDAPVANPLHRAVAAALDWAMVLIAYGCFLLAFRILGGQVFLNKTNLMVFGGALLLVGFTYSLLPVIAGTETPGMRWTRLRLTTFDGLPLEPRHRLLRMLGSCLSVCTAVGLLWSLVDEESLAWQDHISRTFPTLAVDR
ncbi:MAG: RDD family protein [Bryobacteraceae bacterium]